MAKDFSAAEILAIQPDLNSRKNNTHFVNVRVGFSPMQAGNGKRRGSMSGQLRSIMEVSIE